MVAKVNGAAQTGAWFEKNTAIIKVTFSSTVAALTASTGGLVLEGTATAVTGGGTADSSFGIVESAVVQALKVIATKATILAVSPLNGGTTMDVLVGHAEGWISPLNDGFLGNTVAAQPAQGYSIAPAKARMAATAGNVVAGQIVDVSATATATFGLRFAKLDGTAAVAVAADLNAGPGLAPGSAALPMGGTGFYMTKGSVGLV